MQKDFIKIANENQNLILKVCNMFCRNEDDKKDLFQDILIQLWKSYPSFRNESKITTWMYRIALNTAITGYRRKKNKPVNENILDEVLPVVSHHTKYEKSEQSELLYKAINKLTAIEKSIILLYLENYSSDEISCITGVTSVNARVKINRIKKKLKKMLEHKI